MPTDEERRRALARLREAHREEYEELLRQEGRHDVEGQLNFDEALADTR